MLKKYRTILLVFIATVMLISNRVFAEETNEEVAEETVEESISEDSILGDEEAIDDTGLENEQIDEIEDDEKLAEEVVEDEAEDTTELDEEDELNPESEELIEEDEEIELREQSFTAMIDGHKIEISGNLPKGTQVEFDELTNVSEVTYSVLDVIDDGSGYFESESFEISMSYEEDGKIKSFVPADFDETCQVSVSGISGNGSITAFSIGNRCKEIANSSTFTMSDETAFTVGVIFDTATSIVGSTVDGVKNCRIYAKGDGVEYATNVNKDGWYLFTDVDYSKAYFGCSFEITTE